MERKKGAIIVPKELTEIFQNELGAKEFFESLSDSYKRGYCDWVGSAKQQTTRQARATKALVMLKNKQKTLKT